jgi:hypothetical protein
LVARILLSSPWNSAISLAAPSLIDRHNFNSADASVLAALLSHARAQPSPADCVLVAGDARLLFLRRLARGMAVETLSHESDRQLVGLATYDGGHGWRAGLYDYIRGGIEWLEKNSSVRGRPEPVKREVGFLQLWMEGAFWHRQQTRQFLVPRAILPGCGRQVSGSEPECRTSLGPGGLMVPVLRRGMCFQRPQKTRRDGGYVIDRGQERVFVCPGWLIKTADFSYELKRCGPNFLGGYRRIEVEKRLDVSAHGDEPSNYRRTSSTVGRGSATFVNVHKGVRK